MKLYFPAILVSIAALAQTPGESPISAPPAAEASAPASQGASTLNGVASNADTKKPAGDVVVTMTGPGGFEEIEVTDAKGKFTFKNLSPGSYILKFEHSSYRLLNRPIDISAGRQVQANIALLPEQLEAEEIVVTGSRIPRLEVSKAAPVTGVNREQMQTSGKATVGAILQALPEQTGGTNTQVNNGGDGATRVDLRGFGAQRTLVLLNGRRVVPGGTGADSSVDMSTIPSAAISRIEVLKDGASAVYGSDAISGVVNIITRQNFTGVEVNGYTGVSQRGDGFVYDLGFTTGVSGDRGNVLFSGGYYGQLPVWAGDRSFSRYDRGTVYYDWSNRTSIPGGSTATPTGYFGRASGTGNALWDQLKAENPSAKVFTYDNGSFRPFSTAGVNDAGGDLYNYQPENYLTTPLQRLNLFSTGTVKIIGSIKGYYEAMFAHRESDQKLAPEPVFFGASEGITVSGQSVYNPLGVDFNDARVRMKGLGNRNFMQDLGTFRIVTGFRGEIPLLKAWTWDISLNYGRTQGVQNKEGLLQRSKVAAAVGPSFLDENNVARCGTDKDNVIEGCVPLNIFGGPGVINDDMKKYLSYKGAQYGFNQQIILEALTSAGIAKVGNAASEVGLAAGYVHRREAGASIPDPLTAKGDTTGNKGEATAGSYWTNEAFAEINAPLIGRIGEFAGEGNLLELSAAARLVYYNNFGDNLSYKLGGRISPIKDITLRGTYTTAFRAPDISQLFSGAADAFPQAKDPCSDRQPGSEVDAACDAAGVPDDFTDDRAQLLARVGGNAKLQPETASTVTLGAVIQPRFLSDLTFSVDYYNISVKDAITSPGASVILNACYPSKEGAAPTMCEFVQRDPASHLVSRIDNRLTNVGSDRIGGVDFALDYDPVTPIGRLGFSANLNWLDHYDTTLADGRTIRGKNNFDLGLPLPEWKGTFGVRWAESGFNATANLRWKGAFRECQDNNCQVEKPTDPAPRSRTVPAYATLDLNGGYRFTYDGGAATTLRVGINNLMDQIPPYIVNGPIAASHFDYDFMGRYFYMNLTHEFQ